MRGLHWCAVLITIGVPLGLLDLLGLAINTKALLAAGTGMVAIAVMGWPVLLLAGALSDLANPQRR